MQLFGIRFVGLNHENAERFLFSVALIVAVVLVRRLFHALTNLVVQGERARRARFWTHQGTSLFAAVLIIIGLVSIWFGNPQQLTAAVGLFTAGLAFALQKVITSVAGYFVVLRGRTFTVGDRIMMGSVRGDVIALGFLQTTIMEMGQPPGEQDDKPPMWVHSRQFSGRIVTVSNSKIFDEPVYNYTRDFPYIWEEIHIPIAYKEDRVTAEKVLLESVARHALVEGTMESDSVCRLKERYHIAPVELEPKVYYRLTDNWIELSVRFLVHTHGAREAKSAMSKDILAGFDAGGIEIASATYDVVGFPPVEIKSDRSRREAV